MGAVIKFATMVGLRPTEACESVRLINNDSGASSRILEKASESVKPLNYYNPDRQVLEHFRFPQIFLRRTKKAYISFITREMLSGIGVLGPSTPTWNAIRLACRRRGINMNMHLCRKIFASHLRASGIEPEIVDLLQGRVSQSVLVRNYLVPSKDLKDKVLTSLVRLKQELEKE
jgi:intergrase/recombinase